MSGSCPEIRFPSFTKINLGLELVGPRPDGYHEMVTLYQAIDLRDLVSIRKKAGRGATLTCDDPAVPVGAGNLVLQAIEALRRQTRGLPGLHVHLEKRAPAGGGLGGGSGNAAAVLLALDRWLGLRLGSARLSEIAAGLGSDVPFFLQGGLCLGIRRGEVVIPLPDLPSLHVVLVMPGVAVSTAEVFARTRRAWGRSGPRASAGERIAAFLAAPGRRLEGLASLRNDLAPAARPLVVGYARMVRGLRDSGALLAMLSGSGSTVFGVYRSAAGSRRACRDLSAYVTSVTTTIGRGDYLRAILGAVPAGSGGSPSLSKPWRG